MRKLIFIVVIGGLLFFLATTNPNRADYIEWLNNKTLTESTNWLEKGAISLVGDHFFDMTTSRKDYYLFSVYTTDFTDIGKGKMKSVGVFNKFFPISGSE